MGRRVSLLLSAALLASAGCAPSGLRAGSISDSLDGPDAIVALGRAGEIVYALTRSRQLRAWNLRTRVLRTLDRGGAIGIARDGAIALRGTDTVIEAWEPSSGRLIATHRFEYGFGAVRGVSPAAAYVVAKLKPVSWPPEAAAQPPPDRQLVSWDLASGRVEVAGVGGCDDFSLSVDGTRTLCDLAWSDRPSAVTAPPPALAPEWAPSDPGPEPSNCVMCGPQIQETGLALLSAWLSDDGSAVYVTYTRTVGGREWRLDRWIPDPAGQSQGHVEHLAVSHEPIADAVVAVTRDGRTVLTNPGRRPPLLRHAPGYEGVPLLAPPVTTALFSQDERFVITGHGDGRLRLWEADSGRFEAISPD